MEKNSSSTNLEIKQEVVDMPGEPAQHVLTTSIDDIKAEVEDATSELAQEHGSNSLKVITIFCANLQDQIEKTKELSTPGKEMSAQTKAKRQVNKKQAQKKVKQNSQNMEDMELANTQCILVKEIPVEEKQNNNNSECVIIKEEVKDTSEMLAVNKAEVEQANSLLTQINCKRRKRKSKDILIKNENLHQMDDLVPKPHKCKPKGTKTNKTARPCKSQKKNLHKPSKNETSDDQNKNKNIHSDDINLSSDSDNQESDLQEFFDTIKPKKRRYRPRQRQALSEEEQAEKERLKLQRRTCQICSAVFALPDGLRNHIRSKHTFEKPYSCKFCGEQFSTRSSHSLHRRRHHGFQPFLCNLCGKTFLQKAHMEIHMRIHIPSKDKIRDVKCSFCPNVYTSKLNLKKHMLTKHTDPSDWKHECNVCNKKCFSTTDLTHHMRRHNDERKYKCVICGRGFFTKQTMNVHFRTHSASTAFNCEHCSKGYRSNEALQHHMLKVHGIGEVKPVSAPKHFCPICQEGFRQRARLEKHLVIHETGEEEYPFKCERCNKQYKARNYFTIHMLDKHKEFLDDAYFKTHFKLSSRENYTNFNEAVDIQVGNSNNSQEFL